MSRKKYLKQVKQIGFHKLYALKDDPWEEYYADSKFDNWKDYHRRNFSRIRKINHRNKKRRTNMFKCTHYDICMENYGFCEKNHDRCESYGDCDYCQYRLTCKQTLEDIQKCAKETEWK